MRKLYTALLSTTALLGGFSIQSAVAADLAVRPPPPAAPVVSRWDGLYASFSAGETWTKATDSLADFSSTTDVNTFTGAGFNQITTTNTTFNAADSLTGRETGAVFTFTMGYNLLLGNWLGGRWLAGIQSEVSLNRNNIRLSGTNQNTTNQVTQTIFNGIAGVPTTTATSNSFAVFSNLENRWTISEMARLGYLVTPDWLIYGLVGWSEGGFEADQGLRPFTLNGFTWGAGVEKDFGWLRAFVQYKGINYGSRNINVSAPSSTQTTTQFPGFTQTVSTNVNDSATRRFSADVNQVTAGVTIPINFNRLF